MSINQNVLGLIFASINDSAVIDLTKLRTMGSIPYGGRYRLVDFPLSNMVNSGISEVGVITKSNYGSLLDHLGSGREWDLARKKGGLHLLPPFSQVGGGTYQGRLEALLNFHGTDRRFEYKGTINGITIVDDYAHHPTEIAATLHAALNYPHKTLWCIFQPHTYTRTKAFLPQFAKSLALADKVILADIYAARETDTLGISSADLQTLVQKEGKECFYFHTFEEIEDFVLKNCINGDLLITMGAGDVVNIGENLLSR